MKRLSFIALIPLCLLCISTSAQSAGDIEGIWLRGDKKNYKVEIYPCGAKYCGKLVWLKEATDEDGNPRKDINNPDKSKRNNPLLGTDVLRNFNFDGRSWKGGQVYSFNRGKYYDAQIKLKENTLHLSISILFFSRNYTWIKSQ